MFSEITLMTLFFTLFISCVMGGIFWLIHYIFFYEQKTDPYSGGGLRKGEELSYEITQSYAVLASKSKDSTIPYKLFDPVRGVVCPRTKVFFPHTVGAFGGVRFSKKSFPKIFGKGFVDRAYWTEEEKKRLAQDARLKEYLQEKDIPLMLNRKTGQVVVFVQDPLTGFRLPQML